jgi:hypothetical protein
MKKKCSKCGEELRSYWLKDGVCNACRNPESVVVATVDHVVDGHESADTNSPLAGDGKFPPFRIFNLSKQDYLPGTYETRKAALEALTKLEN